MKLILVLPFRLPTWNQILAMPLKNRMRTKKLIREFVSMSILEGGDWRIQTESMLRPRLTASFSADYYLATHIDTSRQLPTAKSEPKDQRKPLSRLRLKVIKG